MCMVNLILDIGIDQRTDSLRFNLAIKKSHIITQREAISNEKIVIASIKENCVNDKALV